MLATQTNAWRRLCAQAEKTKDVSIESLFVAEPKRSLAFAAGGLMADFSNTHLDTETLTLLTALAKEQELELWREKMFLGEAINVTEKRAVLHTALRASDGTSVFVDGRDVMPEIRDVQKRLCAFVQSVRSGARTGATGRAVKTVVNIGIGGSDLGPRLVVSALRDKTKDGVQARFVANVDATDMESALADIDPASTLFVVVSKTFTTQETLLNASVARKWVEQALGKDAVARHFVAVSSNRKAVQEFGLNEDALFDMWDWVGGRYSLWSAVGLSIALALGWDCFQELLEGAREMDEHFRSAPLERNLPVLLGLTGVWYRNFRNVPAVAVLPYSERLRELPRYLQQLDMESNGKSVTREGVRVDYETAPVVFGECGSVGQHSFHQWLHQGTGVALAEFIGVRHRRQAMTCEDDAQQNVLRAHLSAQREALKSGRKTELAARDNPGNKPSIFLDMECLCPQTLGGLLALYEHKVFVQGVVWGINSFDQYGVELGKSLVSRFLNEKRHAY